MSDADPQRVPLRQTRGDEGLISVAVAVRPGSARNVRFDLVLLNESGATITVENPYSEVTYHLIAESGTPVQVKAPPSGKKVHGRRDPAERLAYLALESVRVCGEPAEIDEFVESTTTELPSDHSIELSAAVTSSIDPVDRETLDQVPEGEYSLVVSVRTVVVDEDGRHPVSFRTEDDLPVAVLGPDDEAPPPAESGIEPSETPSADQDPRQ